MLHIKPLRVNNSDTCNLCLRDATTYEVSGKSRLVIVICEDCIREMYSKSQNKDKANQYNP